MSLCYDDDEELVFQIRNGDEDAYNKLAGKYYDLSCAIACNLSKSMNYFSYSTDEFIYDYFMTLKSAIETYENGVGTFRGYLILLLTRRYRRTIKNRLIKSKATTLELDSTSPGEDGRVVDFLSDKNEITPDMYVNMVDITLPLRGQTLTHKDITKQKVYILRLFGHSLRNIAKIMNMDVSRVRRILDEYKEKELSDMYLKLK
ncbi:MAG: hypothetical protein K6E11_02225 [Bacilli bacterium]|nr:hypothetical protein [Bacilli bacterium]